MILGLDWFDSVVTYMNVTKKRMAVMSVGIEVHDVPIYRVEGSRSSISQNIPPMAQKLVNAVMDTRGMEKGHAYVGQTQIGKTDAVRVQEGYVEIEGGMREECVHVALVIPRLIRSS